MFLLIRSINKNSNNKIGGDFCVSRKLSKIKASQRCKNSFI